MSRYWLDTHMSSVFYSCRQLDSDTTLETGVELMPLLEYNVCSYTFTVVLNRGEIHELETVEDVTCDKIIAEQIFDKISTLKVFPCHLFDVVYDIISSF